MQLTPDQIDRACGVVLGSAIGDALGAGYEFTHPAADLQPAMIGGGLGNFAPGEWTDDTSQAVAILQAAAEGLDLRSTPGLDAIAEGFLRWNDSEPADIGNQTAAVFGMSKDRSAAEMADAAQRLHDIMGRSAGNGSLMRTGPVVLAHLEDPQQLVEAAIAVSRLTHVEDLATEACAVWCLLIRHTVLTGELPTFGDIQQWSPRPDHWRAVLANAEAAEPGTFQVNGWSVGALQAAWSAITHTAVPASPPDHFREALATAIRIGHDTDTVAAIAGALLGARWGMAAVPTEWRSVLHGWPGISGDDLEQLARRSLTRYFG